MTQILLVEPIAYWEAFLKPPLESVVGPGNVLMAYNFQYANAMLKNRGYAVGIFSSDIARKTKSPIEQKLGLELADKVASLWNGYDKIVVVTDNPDIVPEVHRRGVTRVYGKFKPEGEMRRVVRHWIHLPRDLVAAGLLR